MKSYPDIVTHVRVFSFLPLEVLGRKGAVAAAVLHPTARHPRRKGTRLEGQGVTSWSSDDLRVKYRGEREREETYEAVRLQEQVAETLEQDYGQVGAIGFVRNC